jgi:hypothetical protein
MEPADPGAQLLGHPDVVVDVPLHKPLRRTHADDQ